MNTTLLIMAAVSEQELNSWSVNVKSCALAN